MLSPDLEHLPSPDWGPTSVLWRRGSDIEDDALQEIWRVQRTCPLCGSFAGFLCNPVDCSPPGSSIHGVLQARILEWVAVSFSRGSSQPRDLTQVSHVEADTLTSEPPGKPHRRYGEFRGYVLYVAVLLGFTLCINPGNLLHLHMKQLVTIGTEKF